MSSLKKPKQKKMKKIKIRWISLVAAVCLISACLPAEYWKLRLDIPQKVGLDLDNYQELVVADFLVQEPAKGFDLSQELTDYLTYELGQGLKKLKVSHQEIELADELVFKNLAFWQERFPSAKETVIITGSVKYAEETRKAILKKEKKRFDDPFPEDERLVTRIFYTLQMDVYFIDSRTGETIHKKNFKETRSSKNPNQTAYFAFFDLIQAVKDKMLDALLGGDRIQQRYLISK